MVTPPKKTTAKASKKNDDDDEDFIEQDEPEAMSDDENKAAEPQPTPVPIDPSDEKMATTGDLKSATKAAQEAVTADRAREVPLLDTYKAAAHQRQADWEKDAKELFREEDLSKERKAKFLEAISTMDLKAQAEQRELQKEATERQIEADKELKRTAAKELREEADRLEKEAEALKAEKHIPNKHTKAHAA